MENSVENQRRAIPALSDLLVSAWAADSVVAYFPARDGPGGEYRRVELPPMEFDPLPGGSGETDAG